MLFHIGELVKISHPQTTQLVIGFVVQIKEGYYRIKLFENDPSLTLWYEEEEIEEVS